MNAQEAVEDVVQLRELMQHFADVPSVRARLRAQLATAKFRAARALATEAGRSLHRSEFAEVWASTFCERAGGDR